MKTKFSPDIGIRWLIAAAKVAVLFGLLLFLLSFCSCSSARKAESVSISSSDTVTMVSGRVDSVSSGSAESSWYSQILKITGLEIVFPDPGKRPVPDTMDMVDPAPRKSPSKIRIDALELDSSSGSEKSEHMDSVSSESKSGKAVSDKKTSETKIRSPTATKWQAVIVLVFVLLLIAYTACNLYSSNRPRDQTLDP